MPNLLPRSQAPPREGAGSLVTVYGHGRGRDGAAEADLAGNPVTVNLLLPGGATLTGMVPEGLPGAADAHARTLEI